MKRKQTQPDRDVATLPQWAQSRIRQLEQNNEYWKAKALAVGGTLTTRIRARIGGETRCLPNDSRITFCLPPDNRHLDPFEVEVFLSRENERRVEVRMAGHHALAVPVVIPTHYGGFQLEFVRDVEMARHLRERERTKKRNPPKGCGKPCGKVEN